MGDDLLRALGKRAREDRAAADEAAGQAPAVDDAARDEMVEAALRELAPPVASVASAASVDVEEAAVEQPSVAKEKIVDARGRFGPRRSAAFAAIALAAGIALFFGLRKSPLPAYELAVQGGTSEWRGDDPNTRDRVQVRSDGTLELLARPDRPANRPVEARAFATHGAMTKVLPVEISSQGVVRIAGKAEELFGPAKGDTPDEWRVVIAVGNLGSVPATAAEVRASDDVKKTEITVLVTTK